MMCTSLVIVLCGTTSIDIAVGPLPIRAATTGIIHQTSALQPFRGAIRATRVVANTLNKKVVKMARDISCDSQKNVDEEVKAYAKTNKYR